MKHAGIVSQIWRYPLKGFNGEPLRSAIFDQTGVVGDQAYLIRDSDGKILGPVPKSGSTQTSTLEFSASLGEDSGLRIAVGTGVISTGQRNFAERLSGAVGIPVTLESAASVRATRAKSGRAVHVITDSSIQGLRKAYPEGDFDFRRFRPNLVLSSVGGSDFAEVGWVGESLTVGETTLRIEAPNERCVVTTLRQTDLPHDKRILETIARVSAGALGVMCTVELGGRVSVGDRAFLVSG